MSTQEYVKALWFGGKFKENNEQFFDCKYRLEKPLNTRLLYSIDSNNTQWILEVMKSNHYPGARQASNPLYRICRRTLPGKRDYVLVLIGRTTELLKVHDILSKM